ncbi:thioesterase II family protein [Pseudosporangium ferrugineum]|uniref:Surfactin synthase thioesterase subunit n=1 Tax=Pseudosporangium ferrugineum TaxID=439699 RepID=A0A2T0SEJ7_9ACTN|nr:alpha/beta fold hydrolase [Pseudosporangium ferrugineum]PRY31846.1 surfactin synthase thioesterase subunit [Pseudosporangium ferrugineum]
MPVQLLCVPFAGAGASFFHPWRDAEVAGVTVHPVQLPGRERRIAEAPCTDVHRAADGLLEEVARLPLGPGPLALFGHSLGAVLAYELARRLEANGIPVARLFVSGSPDPWTVRERRASGLDDDRFLARVEELAGYRHPVFDHPEMREILLPALRADVEMHEAYRPLSAEPLAAPITVLHAVSDELVSLGQAAGWKAATAAAFELVELPGGHMYLTGSPAVVLSVVARSTAEPAVRGPR